jgi:hypothetical protein
MAERLQAVGGSVRSGPNDRRGWRVQIDLPVGVRS